MVIGVIENTPFNERYTVRTTVRDFTPVRKLMKESIAKLDHSELESRRALRSAQYKILLGAAQSMLQVTRNSRQSANNIQQ